MKRALGICLILGAAVFWWVTTPKTSDILLVKNQVDHGEMIAIAAGCVSCHGADLAGGKAIPSPFGVFYAPNITPVALSDWGSLDYAHAIKDGISKEGKHLYPSFPYTSYATISDTDLGNLIAYLQSVPSVDKANMPHELSLIAKWRRPLGIWKLLRGNKPAPTDRGGYLVETLGHCQECHTPRNALGLLRYSKAFEGGEVYGIDGKVKSKVPSLITGDSASWSKSELVEYFTSGFTPDFDSAGGEMVEVIENLSKLPISDREAIADYILALNK